MRYCEICGEANPEVHHVIFRSEASYLCNVEMNFKYLCEFCHKGKSGPHCNEEVDLKYKRELQDNLHYLFSKKAFYSQGEIKDILNISSSEITRIFKPLKVYKEGYRKDDVILRLMGGKLYFHKDEEEIINLLKLLA